MVVRIARKRMYLWRAVDHAGEILDILVQRRRDKRAALRLMRKLLRKQGFAPKLIVTDKLRSYGAAFHDLHLTCRHEQGLRMNNRAENSHQIRATTRAQDAALQVSRICPALSQHARRRSQQFQPSAAPRLPIDAADLQSRIGSAMAERRCSGVSSGRALPPSEPTLVAVTKPLRDACRRLTGLASWAFTTSHWSAITPIAYSPTVFRWYDKKTPTSWQ